MTQRKTLVTYIPTRVGTIRETNRPARGGVRVFVDGDRVYAQWKQDGRRRRESWPNTPEDQAEAKAYALGVAETIARGPQPVVEQLTLRGTWDRFEESEFIHLREKTKKNYRAHWLKWEVYLGKDAIAEDAKAQDLAGFRSALTKQDYAIGQVHKIITDVKMIHAWGFRRELLALNRLSLYRFKTAKDERSESPGEYSATEANAIIGTLSPQLAEQWRPWAAMMIAHGQGARMNAILHLKWDDVDAELGEAVWRARWDKNGREWRQPLTLVAYSALLTAWHWRQRTHYTGPWVFFSSHERKQKLGADGRAVYHPTSLERALAIAEGKAGVEHQPYRGMHAFRRGRAGDLYEATGDFRLALQYIDDHDMRMAQKYLKRRPSQLRRATDLVDADRTGGTPRKRHQSVTREAFAFANSLGDKLGREDSNLQLRDKIKEGARAPRYTTGLARARKSPKQTPKTRKKQPRKRHQPVTRGSR
jgi:site-specific recombinase XerD